jgi:S-adenosylmethionine hydrolase
MENKVLTPEELSTLKELNEQRGSLVDRFGIIEINIQDLKIQKQNLVEELSKLKNLEYDFGISLQQRYGDVNINLETGEVVPR